MIELIFCRAVRLNSSKSSLFLLLCISLGCISLGCISLGCMPARQMDAVSNEAAMNPSGKSLTDWLSGKGNTEEENETVLEIRLSVEMVGGPRKEESSRSAAVWAEKKLDVLSFNSKNPVSLKPLLALPNLRVLDIQNTNFTQEEVDEVIPQLKNLKTFVPSEKIICPSIAGITCIKGPYIKKDR